LRNEGEDEGNVGGAANVPVDYLATPLTLLRAAQGGRGGVLERLLFDTLLTGDIKKGEKHIQAVAELEKLLSVYTASELYHNRRDERWTLGQNDKLTKEKIIVAALNWGNPEGRMRVLDGYGWTEDEVLKLFGQVLTKKDEGFINGLAAWLNTFWKETAAVHEQVSGATMGKVEAAPFSIAKEDGEALNFTGGYFPIAYNPEKSSKAAENAAEETAMQKVASPKALSRGMGSTKKRAPRVKGRPLLLSFNVIANHVNDVLQIQSMRMPARDVIKLLNNEKVANAIKEKLGRRSYDTLLRWANDVWSVERTLRSQAEVEGIFGGLRRNAGAAIMGYRVIPGLANLFGNMPILIERLGLPRAVSAVWNFYAHPQRNWRLADELSPDIRARESTMDATILEASRRFNPSRLTGVDAVKKHMFWWISFTDQIYSRPLWLAVYQDTLNTLLQEGAELAEAQAKAKIEATKELYAAFGTGKEINLAKVMKSGETLKMFTAFYGFFNAIFNINLEHGLLRKEKGYAPIFRSVALLLVLQPMLETLMQAFLDDEEDNVESFLKKWAANSINTTAGGVPVLRDVTNAVTRLIFEGKSYGEPVTAGLAAEVFNRAMSLYRTVDSVFTKDNSRKDWTDVLGESLQVGTAARGLPDTLANAVAVASYWLTTDSEVDAMDALKAMAFNRKLKKAR
jgi:hypothetical protein